MMTSKTRAIMSHMKSSELILEPHNQDMLMYQEGVTVPLRAKQSLIWEVNGKVLGEGEKIFWTPTEPGEYTIKSKEIPS